MPTIRVTQSQANELTAVLRKRRSEPTTIVLEPGEYILELAALIGPVTVQGEAGADRTIVRAAPDQPLLKVSRDGADIIVRGLTLAGGLSRAGGALEITGSTAVLVEDCVLRDNRAPDVMGGAVAAIGRSRITLRRCLLTGNQSEGGGAVVIRGSAVATIDGCMFARNRAVVGGGLVVGDTAQATVQSCTFVANTASHPVGGNDVFTTGIKTHGPTVSLVNCVLASPRPLVNNAERPAHLRLSHSVVPPGGLDDVRLEANLDNLATQIDLVEVAGDRWALAAGSPARGSADLTAIDSGAVDLLGRPRVIDGRADPGALAGPA